MTRREELYPEIARLREQEGLKWREIAERLGISKSTASDYYFDRTGDRARARKAKTDGTCTDCGARTAGDGGRQVPTRCRACAASHARTMESRHKRANSNRLWTDEQILNALRRASRNGSLSRPMYDGARAKDPDVFPTYLTAIHRFGSWRSAVEAAGLKLSRYHRKIRVDRVPERGCLFALEKCHADLGGGLPPTYEDYNAWAREVGAVSAQTIRNRFGGWLAALDAYLEQHEAEAA